MMSEWREFKLEDIALDVPSAMSTGPFGSAISSKFFQDGGIPVIRGGNLSADITNRMSDDGLVFVSYEKAKEFKRSVVQSGDLIFTCWGTINQVGLITDELKYPEYIISNKQMKLTPDPEKADSLFLYYLFSSPIKQAEILNNGIGAAVPGFNLGQLKGHMINLPPVSEQKTIASILNSFDTKIRHNSQTNQTLEQIAQAIFKSWFVDFDPVRAKIAAREAFIQQHPEVTEEAIRAAAGTEGDTLAHAGAKACELAAICAISGKTEEQLNELDAETLRQLKTTAAFFPDTLVDTEHGELPEGWEAKKIEDVISRQPVGKKFSQKTAHEKGNVPILDQGKSGIIGYHNEEPGVRADAENPIIVFANHTCYMRLVMHDFSAIQNVLPFKSEDMNVYWLYMATRGKQEFAEYKGHWPDFVINEIVIPSGGIDQMYGSCVADLFREIHGHEKENDHLSLVRDALLPKLLSGELEMDDVA